MIFLKKRNLRRNHFLIENIRGVYFVLKSYFPPTFSTFWKFAPKIEQFCAWKGEKGLKTDEHSNSYLKFYNILWRILGKNPEMKSERKEWWSGLSVYVFYLPFFPHLLFGKIYPLENILQRWEPLSKLSPLLLQK